MTMSAADTNSTDASKPAVAVGSRGVLWRVLGWGAAMGAVAVLMGIVLFRVQQQFAPFLLLPLASGGLLGLAAWKLSCAFEVAPGRWITVALLAAVVLLIAAEHVTAWRHYRTSVEQARRNKPELELFGEVLGNVHDISFPMYLRLEAGEGRRVGAWRLSSSWTWASWCFDGLVTFAAAVIAYVVLARRNVEMAARAIVKPN